MSIAAIAGLSLAATGCGKSPSELVAEKVIEQQTDGEVDVDFGDGGIDVQTPDGEFSVDEDGSFTVTGEDGEVITGAGENGDFTMESEDGTFTMSQDQEIPAEWPSDVPQPEGVTVSGSSVMDTGDGTSVTLAGTVDDSAEFMSNYGAALEAAGLTKASEFSSAETDTMTAMYGNDSWTITVGTSNYDGAHQLTLTIYPQTG